MTMQKLVLRETVSMSFRLLFFYCFSFIGCSCLDYLTVLDVHGRLGIKMLVLLILLLLRNKHLRRDGGDLSLEGSRGDGGGGSSLPHEDRRQQ